MTPTGSTAAIGSDAPLTKAPGAPPTTELPASQVYLPTYLPAGRPICLLTYLPA